MSSLLSFLSSVYDKIIGIWNQIYDYKYSIYIFIFVILILVPFVSKVKNKILSTIINILYALAILLFFLFLINKVYDYFDKYKQEHPTEQTTPTQQNTTQEPTQQTPDVYGIEPETENYNQDQYQQPETQKQLFYSVSCSGCYAEGCPNNGYIYSGYDAGSYAYYYGLCQACSCTSVVAHSFWK